MSDVEFVEFKHYTKTRDMISLEEQLKILQRCENNCIGDINEVQKQLQQKIICKEIQSKTKIT